MDKVLFKSNWKHYSGDLKQRWPKVTEVDFVKVDGDFDKLVAMIQERQGVSRDQAEFDVKNYFSDLTHYPAKSFAFTGQAGGVFSITGKGFGLEKIAALSDKNFGQNGTVTVSGVVVPVTSWSDTVIKGTLPADTESGTVVVYALAGNQVGHADVTAAK